MPIKVMHINDTLSVGGAERVLVEIANHSQPYGIDPAVCITRGGTDLSYLLNKSIPLLTLGRRSRFDPDGFIQFNRICHQYSPDILHVHSRSTLSFIAFAQCFGLIPKSPVLFSDQNGRIETEDKIPLWFRLWSRKGITKYVGVTESMVRWARKAGIPEDRISVIPNALNLSEFQIVDGINLHDEFKIPIHKLIGVVVGRVNEQKGIDQLIRIISNCKRKDHFVILIIGRNTDNPPYLKKCMDLISEYHLTDNVRFTGQRMDIVRILKGADFALMPSRSESGPLVLIEYLAASLPLIAFRTGNISTRANELGIPGFVQPGDLSGFTKSIDTLIDLPREERSRRGLFGSSIANAEFAISSQMPRWLSIYNNALKDCRR